MFVPQSYGMFMCVMFMFICVYVGDILLRVRHAHTNGSRISMFRAAFHTGYVPIGVWCVQFYLFFSKLFFLKIYILDLAVLRCVWCMVYINYTIGVFMYLTALYHCVLSMFYRCVEVD